MKIVLIAIGARDDKREVDWPNEWRIPVAGEEVLVPEAYPYPMPVAKVVWEQRLVTQETVYAGEVTHTFWECQLWFAGKPFGDASQS